MNLLTHSSLMDNEQNHKLHFLLNRREDINFPIIFTFSLSETMFQVKPKLWFLLGDYRTNVSTYPVPESNPTIIK